MIYGINTQVAIRVNTGCKMCFIFLMNSELRKGVPFGQ